MGDCDYFNFVSKIDSITILFNKSYIFMQSDKIILFVPKIDNSVSSDYIKTIFEKLGTILKINEINYTKYRKVFVHIVPQDDLFKTLLEDYPTVKIVHSMPWYWTCYQYVRKINGPNPNIMAEL
jgi:hypothetical protein